MDQPRNKYVISYSGPMGSKGQQNTAAAFYARKKASTSAMASPIHTASSSNPRPEVNHVSNFSGILGKCPPPAPSSLLKKLQEETSTLPAQHGKVRVILRVANSGILDPEKPFNFRMDQKKKQVTLLDPTHTKEDSNKTMPAAPKMFAFDGLYTDEDAQNEMASSSLSEAINGVVSGVDACLFAFGHASLGKTYTMIGSDESSKTLGIVPTAIAWLFRAVKERKETKNARFAIRVSAMEIGGQAEEVRDLLTGQAASESDNDAPPSQFFPTSTSNGGPNGLMAGLTELRCSTAERAGYYLDAALTSRSTNMAADVNGRDSHFVFSLHVYQYSVEPSKKGGCGVIGGRSRLHLIDFGCCDRTKTSGGNITLSGLGNVILGIFNGQRHLPFKESKVTQMLKECLGSLSCQATMVAHVTPEPSHYSETLHTTQLASRIHRMRRKKASKTGSTSNGSAGSGSSDDLKMNRLVKLASSSSEFTDPSSSEQSCDTVIYVGSRDDDGTDLEHPPVFLPSLNSGDHRGQMAKVLRGTSAEMKSSTLERSSKRHSKSPSQSSGGAMARMCSPTHLSMQPQRLRPGSVGSTPTHSWKLNRQQQHMLAQGRAGGGGSLPRNPKGKMPLTGKVAGYRQPSMIHQHQLQQQAQFFPANSATDPNMMAIYGYMDDHKISMIQQWVECQANQRHAIHQQQHQKAMMAQQQHNKAEPEPFAWLNQPSLAENEDNGLCKVLTQFKTVESDDSSSSDQADVVGRGATAGGINCNIKLEADVHVQPSSHRRSSSSSTARPLTSKGSSTAIAFNDRGTSGGTPPISPHILVPDEVEDSIFLDEQQQQSLRPLEANSSSTTDKLEEPIKTTEGQQSESTKTSMAFGVPCKSDAGTNTASEAKMAPTTADKTITTNKDGGDQFGSIRTIDELYTHCEQLVETLSQASEELKTNNGGGCQNGSGLNSEEVNSHQSSEENLNVTVSSLDANKLHFANGSRSTASLLNEVKVCEDAVSLHANEEFFSKKFDQLAKLHELYQSVSSINDKAKSHLEEARIRNSEAVRSSCLSLSALMTDLERISIHSDANSLCSEPVKMYDYNDFQENNNNLDENNLDDLFDFSINNNKLTVSLSDLDKSCEAAKRFTSELNVANDRSDSPILEGIDQELAKYAQLKDLEKAYQPSKMASPASASNSTAADITTCPPHQTSVPNDAANFHLQRNPDGASNPDLNCKGPTPTSINGNCVPLPLRRSPGNGRSGSEPEDEFERLEQQHHQSPLPTLQHSSSHIKNGLVVVAEDLASDGNSMTSRSSSSIPSKSSPSGCSSMSSASSGGGHHQQVLKTTSSAIMHRPPKASTKRRDERTVLGKSQSTDTSSDIEIWQKPKQQPQISEVTPPQSESRGSSTGLKVPKFSRLFKLSRSPLKVIKDEAKVGRRSKSADSRKEAAASKQPPPQQQPLRDKNKSSQTSKLRQDSKRFSSSANSLKQPSKNAKGTSSFVGCSKTKTTSEAINW